MNDILQWTAVAAAIALAVIFLIKRLKRESSAGCGCGHCCTSCPQGDEFADKCKDKPTSQ